MAESRRWTARRRTAVTARRRAARAPPEEPPARAQPRRSVLAADPAVLDRPSRTTASGCARATACSSIIEDDLKFARIMMELAREKGFKAVVATRGDTGLALANELQPDAITLDIQLPVVDGWTRARPAEAQPAHPPHPGARHLRGGEEHRGATLGAFAYLEKPVSKERWRARSPTSRNFLDRKVRSCLLWSRTTPRSARASASWSARATTWRSPRSPARQEALDAARKSATFDCMVVDLLLPGRGRARAARGGQDAAALPRPAGGRLHRQGALARRGEEARLKKYAESVILKSGGELARAAAQRHRALPAPGAKRTCPSARRAAAASRREAGRVARRQDGARRRRRRAQHLRAHQRAREPRGARCSTPRTAATASRCSRSTPTSTSC